VSRTLNHDQIKAVFQRFDANHDGRLSKREFRRLMDRN
jgi:Ca2+-binding EF-hand superfamily protein